MKKYIPVSVLLISVFSASFFMVVESGQYYATFYQNPWHGYWAAFLVELFLALSAMVSFKDKKRLNLLIRIVMIPLFFVVVGGASLKVVAPMIKQLAESENREKMVALLADQSRQSQANLNLLKGQKINTAIEINRQRKLTDELKSNLKNQTQYPWMIWLVIGFSTFLRFSVQLANLIFAHACGVALLELRGKSGQTKRKSTAGKKKATTKTRKNKSKPSNKKRTSTNKPLDTASNLKVVHS